MKKLMRKTKLLMTIRLKKMKRKWRGRQWNKTNSWQETLNEDLKREMITMNLQRRKKKRLWKKLNKLLKRKSRQKNEKTLYANKKTKGTKIEKMKDTLNRWYSLKSKQGEGLKKVDDKRNNTLDEYGGYEDLEYYALGGIVLECLKVGIVYIIKVLIWK